MKTIISVLTFFVFLCTADLFSQPVLFRSGTFLRHSTGGCIWGPNGSTTSVPQEITIYNNAHGYTGQYAVALTQNGWPVTPWNNEWERWHRIFDNQDTVLADIRPFMLNNKIIIIKSCFPSSALTGIGVPADTLQPSKKTIYNYKWHWRSFLNVMKAKPQNFFVIWTNAPLVAGATNINAAGWSKKFCRWAKDTLAAGLDSVFGAFPQNVYVFDFFGKLTDTSGFMLPQYAQSSSDSHPNAAATLLVAPQFVQEVFDHSILYEGIYTGLQPIGSRLPAEYSLSQNFPNPFNPVTKIKFDIPKNGVVKLQVFDILGREVRTLVNRYLQAGTYESVFESAELTSGIYFYRLTSGDFTETKRMVLLK